METATRIVDDYGVRIPDNKTFALRRPASPGGPVEATAPNRPR